MDEGRDIALGPASASAPADDPAAIAALVRSVRRDPEHFAERAIRLAVQRLAEPSWDWAQGVQGEQRVEVADARVRRDSFRIARVDGAVSGTPFLLALVPAYVAVLWQQARMTMRLAALHGRDPREPGMVAELLALRGVHPTPEAAARALAEMDRGPAPRGGRRPLRGWIELVRRVLVLAGFLNPPREDHKPSLPRRAFSVFAGGVIWVSTWVFPLTFMALMSWTCESATRTLAARVDAAYGAPLEAAPARSPGALRLVAMVVGLALPLGLIAAAVAGRSHGHAVAWLSGVAALTGLALVVGLGLLARR